MKKCILKFRIIFIYLFSFMLFWSWLSQLNAFEDNQLKWLEDLKSFFEIKSIKIDFYHDRFEKIYENALNDYNEWNYLESIQKVESYIDKVFIYDCKWIRLLSQNYFKLGQKNKSKAALEIFNMCKLITALAPEDQLQKQYNIVKDFKSSIKNMDLLDIYVNYIWFRTRDFNLMLNNENLNKYITYNLLNAFKDTWGEWYKKKELSYYKDLLSKDFVFKPVIAGSLWSKFNDKSIIDETLKYEELLLAPYSTYVTTHHNAYDFYAKNIDDERESLYYYFKSMSYNIGFYEKYERKILGLIFNTKLFEEQDIFSKLSKIMSVDGQNFFNTLSSIDSDSDINTLFSYLSAEHSEFHDILPNQLRLYIIEKFNSKDELYELYKYLLDTSEKDNFLKLSDELKKIHTDFLDSKKSPKIEDSEIKTERPRVWEKYSFNVLSIFTKNNLLLWASIFILLAIVSFIVFVFVRSK